jgi:predicted lipoprotein with Yx(FWY)xxD motif
MKKFAVILAVSIAATGAGTAIAGSTPWVGSGKTSLGTVLTSASGRTLYLFEGDTKSKLGCNGSCLKDWPPLWASGSASAAGGATNSELGTVKRGSSKQVTYNGHPVYTYSGDSKAGQVWGEGLKLHGKLWYAISPSGVAVTSSKGASSSSSGGSTGSGW